MRVVPHSRFAAPAIRLDPQDETETCGRSGFFIHGDNAKANRSASTGCIVVGKRARECVSALIALGFTSLWVVI